MTPTPKLAANECLLLVVDIQEAFKGHIAEMDDVIARIRIMIRAAQLLDVPIIVTEQYPRGLGRTLPPVREVLGDCTYYDKVAFSCLGDDKIKQAVLAENRPQLLLVGIETHVCIAQTAFDALTLNLTPFLLVDALGSRRPLDARVALDRLRNAGAVAATTEAVLLEILQSSRHPQFKEISQLIK